MQNFGRRQFKNALEAYSEQYGFTVSDVNLAYTSQTCHRCGYVDKKNRNGNAFKCLCCGQTAHADGNAARNHIARARDTVGR
ncbi:zinc ribbon domain-containing protein [Cupriavidus basilensis]